jgi:hypothetical protein
VHVYEGPPLPRSETSLVAVQGDDNQVKLRIEAVDGRRLPGAEREFYHRDREVIVRPGPHTIEVRGWYIVEVGPDVVLPDGERGNYILHNSAGPVVIEIIAFAGRDLEIQAQVVDFALPPSEVRPPSNPASQVRFTVVERPR